MYVLCVSQPGAPPVSQVFDTFDADGGGYMDADEARDMVRGLQKTAEDAEQQRNRMKREARKARTLAIRRTTVAMAPTPDPATGTSTGEGSKGDTSHLSQTDGSPTSGSSGGVQSLSGGVLPEDGKHRRTSSGKRPGSRAPFGKEKAGELLLGGVRVAASAAAAILSSTRAGSSDTARERAVRTDEIIRVAASRLLSRDISRAWNAWTAHYNATLELRMRLQQAVGFFVAPQKASAFAKWVEYYVHMHHAMKVMQRFAHRLAKGHEFKCFQHWREISAEQRTVQLLARSVQAGFNRRRLWLLTEVFDSWYCDWREFELQREIVALNPCAGLMLWFKIKFDTRIRRLGGVFRHGIVW